MLHIARSLLFTDAFEFFVVRLLIHELTAVLVALGPVLFTLDLGLELGAVLDGPDAMTVGGWLVR